MARSARRKEAVVAVLIGAATFVSNLATAQSYPSRPVRIVVPGTGGGGDFAARLIDHAGDNETLITAPVLAGLSRAQKPIGDRNNSLSLNDERLARKVVGPCNHHAGNHLQFCSPRFGRFHVLAETLP